MKRRFSRYEQETFEFWDEEAFPLLEITFGDSLSRPASAAEHFDGDADDVFFEDEEAVEEFDFEGEEEEMRMPCDMDVSDDEALSMEGDLDRLRFTVSDEEPVLIITSRPSSMGPVVATPFGFLMQQIAIDPIQEW